MGTVAIVDRKQVINERYWKFSLVEADQRYRITFPERTGQIAESLGISKATIKYNVEPRTFTLKVRCDRCKEVSEVTRTFASRYLLESRYTCVYSCPSCEVEQQRERDELWAVYAEREREQAAIIAAHNDDLRKKYGPLIVRECPNCGYLTHIEFDPMTAEFYEVCGVSEEALTAEADEAGFGPSECNARRPSECNARLKAYFTEEQRQAFLRKMIALLQAKVSNVEPSAPAVTLPS